MEEKILNSVKDMLGIHDKDAAFDNEVLVNINTVFSTLYQLGVGSNKHYSVLTGEETWDEIFKEKDLIDMIKLYTYMKVRIVFDPPSNSSILQALTEQMKEIEWRILMEADPANYFEDESSSLMSGNVKKVESLPDDGEPGVVYLVPNNGKDANTYDEYFWVKEDSRFELFGTVQPEIEEDNAITDEAIDSMF